MGGHSTLPTAAGMSLALVKVHRCILSIFNKTFFLLLQYLLWQALWLLQSPVVGQLCSYVAANQTWNGGARLELNLVIDTVT